MKYNVIDHTVSIFKPVTHSDATNDPDHESIIGVDKPMSPGNTDRRGKKAVDEPIVDPAGKPENFIPFEEL